MNKVDEAIEAIRALNKMFHFSNENIAIVEVELYKLRTALEQIIKTKDDSAEGYLGEVHSIAQDALGYNETIIPDGDGVEAEEAVQVSPKCICKPAEFTTGPYGYGSGVLYGPDPKCPIHQWMYMMRNGIKDTQDFSL